MTTHKIEAAWQIFKRASMAPDASPAQIEKQRTTFFSGCVVMHTMLLEETEGGDMRKGMEFLSDVHNELVEFTRRKLNNLDQRMS